MELKKKGQQVTLELIPKEGKAHGEVKATLSWRKAVDLDLHGYFAPRGARLQPASKGFLGLGKKGPTLQGEGLIDYRDRGSKTGSPFIYLDKDAGVGDVGGENEENMHFTDLSNIGHILIVANIYGKPNANFASYDGKVTVKSGDQVIEVPLTESRPGSYCIVAHIDNTGPQPVLRNVNRVQKNRPTIGEFLQSR